jgi:dTMP kinase
MRNTRLGKKITKLTKSKNLTAKQWLRLFTEDRKYHIKNEILPALKKGKIVISDRYYYSTLAYQLPENKWNSYIRQSPKPDLAFICEVPAEISLKRIKKALKTDKERGGISVFEKLKTLRKLRKKYLRMKRFSEVRIIDSKPSPEKIFEKIKKEAKRIVG